MLRIDEGRLEQFEIAYPGIWEMILRLENSVLPSCHYCRGNDTAIVQCGIIGRTIHIAGATSKFKLITNGPRPGKYFCNQCGKFFGEADRRQGGPDDR